LSKAQGWRLRRAGQRLQQISGRSSRSFTKFSLNGSPEHYLRMIAALLIALALVVEIITCSAAAVAASVAFGTGFAIADGSLILTNFHVVRDCIAINIKNVGSGQLQFAEQKSDLAIIKPATRVKNSLRLRVGPPIRLGDEIIVIGFPFPDYLSSEAKVTTGIISSLSGFRDDTSRMQISAPIQPGNSGGPVLDRAGNVVGIVVSKLSAFNVTPPGGAIPEDVNFAIKSSTAALVLEAHSISFQKATSKYEEPVSDIVAAALSAVVEIQCRRGGNERAVAFAPVGPEASAPGNAGYGAIAWDEEAHKAGWSWKQPTPRTAAEMALSQCGATGCQIVIGPTTLCAALATSEDRRYAGASAQLTQAAARLMALSECQRSKAIDCVVRASGCNK
jgi:S1-C subfamily serine protease